MSFMGETYFVLIHDITNDCTDIDRIHKQLVCVNILNLKT